MTELSILPDGEVKLGCETVGRITWATGSAYMDVSGTWEREGEGFGVDEEEWDELVNDRDDLADELDSANVRVGEMRLALRGMIALYEAAAGNCSFLEYKAAIALLTDEDGADG